MLLCIKFKLKSNVFRVCTMSRHIVLSWFGFWLWIVYDSLIYQPFVCSQSYFLVYFNFLCCQCSWMKILYFVLFIDIRQLWLLVKQFINVKIWQIFIPFSNKCCDFFVDNFSCCTRHLLLARLCFMSISTVSLHFKKDFRITLYYILL